MFTKNCKIVLELICLFCFSLQNSYNRSGVGGSDAAFDFSSVGGDGSFGSTPPNRQKFR